MAILGSAGCFGDVKLLAAPFGCLGLRTGSGWQPHDSVALRLMAYLPTEAASDAVTVMLK